MFIELKLEGKRVRPRKPGKKHEYSYKLNGDGTAILRVDDGNRVAESLVDVDTIEKIRVIATRLYIIPNANGDYYIYVSTGAKKKPLTHYIIEPREGEVIDHINGNTLDNRRENLRAVDRSTNQRNRKMAHVNKTGFRGVHEAGNGKWSASIHLGLFDTPEEAARAWREAFERLFPGALLQE